MLLITWAIGQTHFTVPQNVWRISIEQAFSVGKWKGHDGRNGWKDFTYKLNGTDYTIIQDWKRSASIQTILIEYGFTDRSTFILNIPKFQRLNQTHSWSITSESIVTEMDKLMPREEVVQQQMRIGVAVQAMMDKMVNEAAPKCSGKDEAGITEELEAMKVEMLASLANMESEFWETRKNDE